MACPDLAPNADRSKSKKAVVLRKARSETEMLSRGRAGVLSVQDIMVALGG